MLIGRPWGRVLGVSRSTASRDLMKRPSLRVYIASKGPSCSWKHCRTLQKLHPNLGRLGLKAGPLAASVCAVRSRATTVRERGIPRKLAPSLHCRTLAHLCLVRRAQNWPRIVRCRDPAIHEHTLLSGRRFWRAQGLPHSALQWPWELALADLGVGEGRPCCRRGGSMDEINWPLCGACLR